MYYALEPLNYWLGITNSQTGQFCGLVLQDGQHLGLLTHEWWLAVSLGLNHCLSLKLTLHAGSQLVTQTTQGVGVSAAVLSNAILRKFHPIS